MLSTKCFQAKAGQINRQWYVIDAKDQVVGRLAAQIAPILMGKHRPTYTPHIDTGDYVVVVNVDKVVFTGDKWNQKVYQRYSGYPGGQKEIVAWRVFENHPERILFEAIRRMMPKNKIGRHMLDKLKLVVGPDHPHQAQQPITLDAMSGRPAAAGIQLAPKPSPPKPKARKPRGAKVAEAAAETVAEPAVETVAEPTVEAADVTESQPETQAQTQAQAETVTEETAPSATPDENDKNTPKAE